MCACALWNNSAKLTVSAMLNNVETFTDGQLDPLKFLLPPSSCVSLLETMKYCSSFSGHRDTTTTTDDDDDDGGGQEELIITTTTKTDDDNTGKIENVEFARQATCSQV